MNKLVFAKNYGTGVFILFIAFSSLYACKSDDDKGSANAFDCDNY